jgi:hypothetical protein
MLISQFPGDSPRGQTGRESVSQLSPCLSSTSDYGPMGNLSAVTTILLYAASLAVYVHISRDTVFNPAVACDGLANGN